MPEQEQPIPEEVRAVMNEVGHIIDMAINPNGEKKFGFALLLFPFGNTADSRLSYINCNAVRGDMVAAMKEFIALAEGRYQEDDVSSSPT